MAGHGGPIEPRQLAVGDVQIGAANPAGENAQKHLSRSGCADLQIGGPQRSRFGEPHRAHFYPLGASRAQWPEDSGTGWPGEHALK
jgi:hypothetical protein